MNRITKDPLLAAARIIVALLIALLVFVLVLVLVGLTVLLTFQRGEFIAELAAQEAPAAAYWLILLVVVLVGAIVGAGIRFLLELRGIVKSVDRGDPFEPANADRLSRMGWLSVAAYGLALVAGAIVAWLQRVVPDARGADIDFSADSGGILLILVLFILARVFRQGAAMREELEGTV
jgi:hypothetical protein